MVMNDGQDGRWIEHDGSPCPCRGRKVEVEQANGKRTIIIAGTATVYKNGTIRFSDRQPGRANAWEWAGPRASEIPAMLRVIRYRFITPDAFLDLQRIARLEPDPVS